MNVYEMYVANGNRAGFWIKRNSWGSTVGQVTRVQGLAEGPLFGNPPYYDGGKVHVTMYWQGWKKETDAVLSCPGTYAYSRVSPPVINGRQMI